MIQLEVDSAKSLLSRDFDPRRVHRERPDYTNPGEQFKGVVRDDPILLPRLPGPVITPPDP